MISGVRSIVAAPLLGPDGCLGMIMLHSRARVRQFSEEDMELLVSLAAAAALRIRNLALTEEAAERKILERELSLAHEIQMGMLPTKFPERPEIDVGATLQPARSVGGDLYDVVADGGAAVVPGRGRLRQGSGRRPLHGGDADAVPGDRAHRGVDQRPVRSHERRAGPGQREGDVRDRVCRLPEPGDRSPRVRERRAPAAGAAGHRRQGRGPRGHTRAFPWARWPTTPTCPST